MTESTVTYIAPNRTDAGAVPKGTTIATHDRAGDGAEVQDVYLDNAPDNPVPTAYDTVLITYTDATKTVISKVEWKLAGAVVSTMTATFAATTDTWVKS